MKKSILFSLFLMPMIHSMHLQPILGPFDKSHLPALKDLLLKKQNQIFHPKQLNPIDHALECVQKDDEFLTLLSKENGLLVGAISMYMYPDATNLETTVLFFLHEDEFIGRGLLFKALQMIGRLGCKSALLFNLRSNNASREIAESLGGITNSYSQYQEVITLRIPTMSK